MLVYFNEIFNQANKQIDRILLYRSIWKELKDLTKQINKLIRPEMTLPLLERADFTLACMNESHMLQVLTWVFAVVVLYFFFLLNILT